nr:fasciclin domain-containing protein [uncultured Carboxylicivirga sp.]
MKKYINHISAVLLVLFFVGCQDAWEDHAELADTTPSESIMQLLEAKSEYSNFVSAIKTTGLDSVLNQPIMLTVWAPANDVFTNLPEDKEELKTLVGNHIAYGSVQLAQLAGTKRLSMVNGKYITVDGTKKTVDQITVNTTDIPAKDGFLQLIDNKLSPRMNIWEYIESYSGTNKQIDYLNSLSGDVFDPEIAKIIGYNNNGEAIYDTLSGMVWRNSFLDNVADLRVEDSTYTLLIVDDAAFDQEFERYTPFFLVSSAPTEEAAALNKEMCLSKITKDYCFSTSYSSSEIPSQLLSVDSVMVPIDKDLIVESYYASNGWIHHISTCPVPLENKILPIFIEAESINRYISNYTINGNSIMGSPTGNLRVRPEASGGYDYVLDNSASNVQASGLILHAGMVASTTYKFYWKAVNDFNGSYRLPNRSEDFVLRQKLGTTTLRSENNGRFDFNPMVGASPEYTDVTATSYAEAVEQEVGSITYTSMRDIYLWLQNEGDKAVTADYIKLVPVFEQTEN